MNSPAIDQILQVALPARTASEPARPSVTDRPAFQDHLKRASSETPSPKSNEPVDAEYNDPKSSERNHDAASSSEDETLKAVNSAVTEAEDDLESQEIAEQDSVELSNAAVVLADTQASTEDEASGVLPSEAKSENLDAVEDLDAEGEVNLLKALGSGNEQTDDSESTEKPVVPTETKVVAAPAENFDQKSKTQAEADPSADDAEIQPTVVNKSQDASTEVETANARKKSKNLGKAVLVSASKEQKLSTTEKQATQQLSQTAIGAEAPGPESSVNQKQPNRKKMQQESNLQPAVTQTESKTLQEEQSLLAAENRPAAGAIAPTSESTSPTTPAPTNLGGEATNFSSRLTDASVVASADAHTEDEPVPTADRARFIQRVGGAIRSAQNRDGEIHLQLRPPELGSLRIEIVVKQGVLTAHLETETSAARAILLDNLPALRERLAEQEIRIEKFDVDVRDESGRQSDNPGTEDRQANRPQAEARHKQQTDDQRQQATPNTAALETSSTLSSSLDVRI